MLPAGHRAGDEVEALLAAVVRETEAQVLLRRRFAHCLAFFFFFAWALRVLGSEDGIQSKSK